MANEKNIGKIIQVIGPVVDVRFDEGKLPKILNALDIQNGDKKVVVEVFQHIGNNDARCIAMSSTDGLVRGMDAVDTGRAINVPVGKETLGRIFNVLGEPIDELPAPKDCEHWDIHRDPPSYEEQSSTTEILETGIKVVDSVAALAPKAEIEGEMGSSHVGVQARLMSQALRKLTGSISKLNCVAIFINQLREKVGVVYGSPEVTPGGRALKFYSTVRIDVRKGEPIKNGSEIIGSRTKAKVVKNKIAPPFKVAEFDIMYGEGISRVGELLDLAVMADVVKKSGAWFSYKENRLGQGRDKVKELFKNDPALAKEIEEETLKHKDELLGQISKKPKGKSVKSKSDDEESSETESPKAEIKAEDTKEEKSDRIDDADIDIMVE